MVDSEWWRDAVVYQVYPRSFADGNGDGMGDLPGVISKLDYLSALGVDAIWLSPFYPSPQFDAGYDVADYRGVDPMFGSLGDLDALIAGAHDRGLRLMVDIVPNHTSSAHEWFQSALAAAPGSPERAFYHFADGRGEYGELPPNNWVSEFGGSAWTRLTEPTGAPGQWYLHIFDTTQPDLNWDNPAVRDAMADVLRFWFDRGVDGIRIDVAHGLSKAPGLPDHVRDPERPVIDGTDPMEPKPYWDQEGVHEIYRSWRRLAESYPGDRLLLAEAWVAPIQRLFRYVRPDELHAAFNFEFLLAGYDATAASTAIAETFREADSVGAPPTWVLANHDTVRGVGRFGLPEAPGHQRGIGPDDPQPDMALGVRRAAAMALLEFSLPGSAYVYQGDELGLPEHTTLPAHERQDPTFVREAGLLLGRDGARCPMPWHAAETAFGFGTQPPAVPWLSQPEEYADFAADVQEIRPESMLHLYRRALALRRKQGLGRGTLAFCDPHCPEQGLIAYRVDAPGGALRVLVNMSPEPVTPAGLGHGLYVLLESRHGAFANGVLAADSAVWLGEVEAA